MIKRLGLVFHWIGFLCLTGFIATIVIGMSSPDSIAWSELPAGLWELLIFDNSSDLPLSIILWVTVSHLPIKFILTGNKNLFPWSA